MSKLPILCQLIAILLDKDFKFNLPIIYINFDIKNNYEVNQTQIGHLIFLKKLKWPYLRPTRFWKYFFIVLRKSYLYLRRYVFLEHPREHKKGESNN